MKQFSRNITACLIMCLTVSFLTAQDAAKGEFAGYLIEKGGKKKEGVLFLDTSNPWQNQRSIKFVTQKVWEKNNGELKKKQKEKFKAKDIQGYGYDGREFFTMKYTAVGSGSGQPNKFTGAMTAVSNLSRNQHIVERVLAGEVSVYSFYDYPPDVSAQVGSEEMRQHDQMIADLRNHPNALVKKGKKGKVKNFTGMMNFKKYIGDCEVVLNKFENKEYMRKGGVITAVTGQNVERAVEIFTDYNNECGN